MRDRIQAPDRADAQEDPADAPSLSRLRRRGESRLLALVSVAAVAFVAMAIVKPWTGSAPLPGLSAASPSPASSPAATSDPAEPAFAVQPADGVILTVNCADTQTWLTLAEGTGPPSGLQRIASGLVCTNTQLGQIVELEVSEPTPEASPIEPEQTAP
jgi:hypothetical protein